MFTYVWIALNVRIPAPYSTGLTEPRRVGRDRGVRESRKARAYRLGAALAAPALLEGSSTLLKLKLSHPSCAL